MRKALAALGAVLLLGGVGAEAASPPTAEDEDGSGLRHTSSLGIRSNRLGLGLFSDTARRTPLWRSDHLLLRDTYVDVGIVTQLSPASFHPGVFVEVVPLAILKLRASFQRLQYFGAFGSIAELPDGDWSPEALDEREESGDLRAAGGHMAEGRGTLRAKVGPVVAMLEGRLARLWLQVDHPYHEPVHDLLLAPNETVLTTKATLGWLALGDTDREFLIVAGQFERYTTDRTDVTRNLLGGAVLGRLPASWIETGRPVGALLVATFLDDPYRQGDLWLGTQWTFTFDGLD